MSLRLRSVVPSLLLLFGFSILLPARGADDPPEIPEAYWVYVGTYTGGAGRSEGIYRLEYDPMTGKLGNLKLAAAVVNPSFLAVHPSGRFLYAVNEVSEFEGRPGGAVSAFKIDGETGDLKALNHQSSRGAAPCHLTVGKAGENVLAANYAGGSVVVLSIASDGSLGHDSAFVQHEGKSLNPQRQEAPHAHSVNLDPENRHAIVADLGLDKVFVYDFDQAHGVLSPAEPPGVDIQPGSGPRHFAFHPDGKHAYVISELASTITAFDYHPSTGALTTIQTVSTLPDDFDGQNWTADIHVHPSGKFLYGSNRGHDSLAIFAVEPDSGRLISVGHQKTGGKTPRNFAIDPTGTFLLAENQESNTIVVFRIDPQTGQLKETSTKVSVPSPVCVQFVPRES